jgi:uncharacterized membrane protein
MTADSASRTTTDRMDLPVAEQLVYSKPIYSKLVSFSVACFVGALITDIVYWRTVAVTWETFSVWLITAGLILAGFAIIAFVMEFFGGRQIRALAWPHAVGYALAVLFSLINAFIHSRDAYTAVVPTGLTLSGLVVVILILSAWAGSALVSRPRIGAST